MLLAFIALVTLIKNPYLSNPTEKNQEQKINAVVDQDQQLINKLKKLGLTDKQIQKMLSE